MFLNVTEVPREGPRAVQVTPSGELQTFVEPPVFTVFETYKLNSGE